MIEGAFYHLSGLGVEAFKRLHGANIRTWADMESAPDQIPCRESSRSKILIQIEACRKAYEKQDWVLLCKLLHAKDQWRILSESFEEASWFDIETDGGHSPDSITCICGYRGTEVSTFVKGENLQDFVHWLEQTSLLVSFNGASFDVPRVLSGFALPDLPCAHIDLRWVAYHTGLKGGLKKIEHKLGVNRPSDLVGVDGLEAIYLWEDWAISKNKAARDKLLRYCAADTVGLKAAGAAILKTIDPTFTWVPPQDLWSALGHTKKSAVPATKEPESFSGISDREAEKMKSFLKRARERGSS